MSFRRKIHNVFFAVQSLSVAGFASLHAATEEPSATPPPEAPPPLASVTLTAPLTPAAPPKQMQIDVAAIRAKYPNLKVIRNFSTVDLVVLGSTARLGATEKDLNDFAVYCFGQLFKGYELTPPPTSPNLVGKSDSGTLNITVQTFPIGVSCELRMGSVGSENTWTTNELRVSTSNTIKDTRLLKTTIATMIAKAAYTLRKTQGL